MTSPYWDEQVAERYRRFEFEFPERRLAGRTIVIAGATGGLGAATAILLALGGARLVLGYHSRRDRAQALSQVIQQRCGQAPQLVEGDLADPATRRALLEAAGNSGAALYGSAVFTGDPARVPFEALDRKAMEASLLGNYVAPVLLVKELGVAIERDGREGSIVLLASMQGVAPFASSLNYAGPKAALAHAARILAKQWTHVRVNVVAPGATVAGMGAASVSAGKYDAYLSSGAIARFGRPEDMARAVRFFLEPDGYITGQVLLVDGGLTLRRDRR